MTELPKPPPPRTNPMATPPDQHPAVPRAAAHLHVTARALLAGPLTWLNTPQRAAEPPPAPGSGGRTVTCDHLRSIPQEHEGRTMHGGTPHHSETDGPAAGASTRSAEQARWQS